MPNSLTQSSRMGKLKLITRYNQFYYIFSQIVKKGNSDRRFNVDFKHAFEFLYYPMYPLYRGLTFEKTLFSRLLVFNLEDFWTTASYKVNLNERLRCFFF